VTSLPVTSSARPDRDGAEARPDLDDRERIDQLVRDFYRQVAMDDLLGPIFAGEHVDWSVHIPKLVDFWAWQLLGERAYDRNPLRAHEPVHARTPFGPELYERWLDLFETTVDEHFTGPGAELAKGRARRMARALRRLLDGEHAPGSEPLQPIFGAATRAQPPDAAANATAARSAARGSVEQNSEGSTSSSSSTT
jgi:hemoglobin